MFLQIQVNYKEYNKQTWISIVIFRDRPATSLSFRCQIPLEYAFLRSGDQNLFFLIIVCYIIFALFFSKMFKGINL